MKQIDKCAQERTRPAETGRGSIVVSRDTGKRYRVIREYRYTLLVKPAWKKSGYPFTLSREQLAGINKKTK